MQFELRLIHDNVAEASQMNLTVEIEQEEDGRWLAEITDLPGVMVYGRTRQEAAARV